MKKVKFIIIAALFWNYCLVGLVWGQESKSKAFTVQSGGDLNVNLMSGDININVWDKSEVSVHVSAFDDEELEGLEIEQQGNTVTVENKGGWWGSEADLDIRVPANFNLQLNTTSGDIHVDGNVNGKVKAQTMGGDIYTNNVNGEINVTTSGGDIRSGDIKGKNYFNTMGGDVRVGAVTGAELNIQTMGGDINVISAAAGVTAKTYGGDIKMDDVKGRCSAVTYGGDIILKTLNGDADLDTKGGDISVEKAYGKLTAKTAGGDIRFDYLEGSLKAKTASGNVYAVLVPIGDCYINASNGDVNIAFPDKAKATVNVSVRLRGWGLDADEDTGITSDFQETSSNKTNTNKDIKKSYVVNGGGNKVDVEVTNSNVSITKGDVPKGRKGRK